MKIVGKVDIERLGRKRARISKMPNARRYACYAAVAVIAAFLALLPAIVYWSLR